MQALSVITAFDNCLERFGMRFMLQDAYIGIDIKEVSTTGELYRLLRDTKCDLIILDYYFKKNSCLTILPDIHNLKPEAKVFVVSKNMEKGASTRVLKAGAKGYINGEFDQGSLMAALRMVAYGNIYVSQDEYIYFLESINKQSMDTNPFDALTDKELEIVEYLKMGCSTSEICERCRLAMSTISTYKNRIFHKLKVDNIISLIDLAKVYSNS